MMEYRIVVDSSANLVHEEGIISVPLKIMTDECEFEDDINLDVRKMAEYMASYKGKSKTSCPNVAEYLEAFGESENVFALAISSKLSGSYNAGRLAVEQYLDAHPDRKAYMFDTLSTGPTMKMMVDKIKECVESGMSFEDTVATVENYKGQTDILYSLESLNNLANNGRVSKIVASGAGLLGIRIIGGSDGGAIQAKFKIKGEKRALNKMFEDMQALGYKGGRVYIDTCFNENAAEEMVNKIHGTFPEAIVKVGSCGGLCSFYAEKGGIIIAFEK